MKIFKDISSSNRNFEKQKSKLDRKENGIYYTSIKLAYKLIEEFFNVVDDEFKEKIYEKRILEPCVGTGDFIFAYLKYINLNFNLSKDQIKTLVYNIYVCDSDEEALNLYFENLNKVLKVLYDIEITNDYIKTNIGDDLIFKFNKDLEYVDVDDYFNIHKFDLVLTNPPYKNLRSEIKHYQSIYKYNQSKKKNISLDKLIRKKFPLSKSGTVNLYEIFVENILKSYMNNNGWSILLVPSGILSNKSSYNLRTHILEDNNLISIMNLDENNRYINAKQALSCLIIKKSKPQNYIRIHKNIEYSNKPIIIEKSNIFCKDSFNSIIIADEEEYLKIKKMNKFKRVKDYEFIINMRGELDLTKDKKYYSNCFSGYPLIRGKNIERYSLKLDDVNEYVSRTFVDNSSKNKYIGKKRIVCQQVVNKNKKHRLSFTLVEKDFILGNSCNFIYVKDNDLGITLYSILGLLNSKIMNWYFDKYSSNNHINNYEIDTLPIPYKTSKESFIVESLVKEYLKTGNNKILSKIDEIIKKLFGVEENYTDEVINSDFVNAIYDITKASISDIKDLFLEKSTIDNFTKKYKLDKYEKRLINGYIDKYKHIKYGHVLNHNKYKLSDLDLEMIENIPQGGNWKDIPQKTINKSRRLKNIQRSGGRTTLYGRIHYNKPSYTITTYFNRPGNGTYVHPIHDRVISAREAARFQSFKDSYCFIGTQKDILNQIGNAVPPLFAYQLAKKILSRINCNKSIDLFTGAGGLMLGFKEAGIESVVCNDIDKSACDTLKLNNKDINVINGDISNRNVKNRIINIGKQEKVDIVCGGPPCQGFSLAGYRDPDDERNGLYREFVEIVVNVTPKVIVFENVKGLLSMNSGKSYSDIISLFKNIGYNMEGKVLRFDDYGIPQKRERVIIIGVRKDIDINPSNLFPEKLTINNKITAKDTIKDLENIPMNEEAIYKSTYKSRYIDYLMNNISAKTYLNSLKEESNNLNNIKKNNNKYEQLTYLI